MQKKLFWCAGKFTYASGSPQLLHYMPLKDFLIEDSLDLSHLFFLRTLRFKAEALADNAMQDEGLMRWMEGTAVKMVGEAAFQILKADGKPGAGQIHLTEFYPGVGLNFEYLKLLLEKFGAAGQEFIPPGLRYEVCGPEPFKLKFEVLHADDAYPCRYAVDRLEGHQQLRHAGRHAHLVIYNHNQTIRQPQDPVVGLEDFFAAVRVPALVAVRATIAAADQWLTTVKGRTVKVPALRRLLDLCRQGDGLWHYRFASGMDADFFLPPQQEATGLFLAYQAGPAAPLPGFAPVMPTG
ncbi:MAG: hypothetical protein Q8M54_00730 [Desulfobaccales bacterium]|nr:hypothetical protein [Desulfobaccales bacterium]